MGQPSRKTTEMIECIGLEVREQGGWGHKLQRYGCSYSCELERDVSVGGRGARREDGLGPHPAQLERQSGEDRRAGGQEGGRVGGWEEGRVRGREGRRAGGQEEHLQKPWRGGAWRSGAWS